MTVFNGNNIYMTIDGVNVATRMIKVDLEPSVESQDTTMGSSVTHVQRSVGLKDTKMSVTLGYDSGNIPVYIAAIAPGLHTIVFGPESNVAGKPKHEQSFIIESAPMSGQSIQKTPVVFELSCVGADTPVTDLFAGGVF